MPSTTPRLKLSEAQTTLLRDLAERPRYCADYYKPALKLVEHGLAEWKGRYLAITPAGVEWIRIGE